MSTLELETPPKIGEHSNGMAMTPEEFDAIEDWDDNFRYELVRGVLVVSQPADIGETDPNDELGHWLRIYRDTHAEGSAFDHTRYEFTIPTLTVRRRADRVIWCGLGRFPQTGDVPIIAIEFVAERARDWRRDHVEKRAEYADTGVKEYWGIDRFRRIMTVYEGVENETVYDEDAVVTTKLLPGFELNLKRLLEIPERCG